MKTKILFIISLLVILNSCDFYLFNCIEGNHQVETETRSVSGFDEIISEGSFNVYISQGDSYLVEVEAESNLIPYISTRRRDDRLIIDVADMRCLQENRPINIYVTAPDINRVVLAGSGEIKSDTLITADMEAILSGSGSIDITTLAAYVDVDLEGSGTIKLHGSAVQTELTIDGSGSIRSYDMEQDECFIRITGSGDAYVRVNDLLDVLITGSGRVFYRGFPGVTTNISGSGSVINDN